MKKGFTLAEVLITLGIIGVVAALTIPTLIQNANEKATVSRLKKVYSTLSSAYTLAIQENGTPENWGLTVDGAGAKKFMDMLVPYLSVVANCDTGGGCFPARTFWRDYTYNDLNTVTFIAKAKLNDGTIFFTQISSADCTKVRTDNVQNIQLNSACAVLGVDINGSKGPNRASQDFFYFVATKYGITPVGTSDEDNNASLVNKAGFEATCKAGNGGGCTAWVIYNENMDYLKCNNLSWGGPTTCQ